MDVVQGAPLPPPPPPTIIFEGQNWPQQTMYHWKGNLSETQIHFKYWKNILISRLYEEFSQNAPQWLKNDCKKKIQTFKIWTYHM